MRYTLKNYIKVISLLGVLMTFSNCRSTYKTQNFSTKNTPKAPNYNDTSFWAVLPSKYPKGLQKFSPSQEIIDQLPADVFYVYPTLITSKKDSRWNVPIQDKEQQEKVVAKAVKYQVSPFATSGKIYVPYYRQAHYRSYKLYEKGGKEAFAVAYQDVKEAFKIFLKRYNKGRPIIIASHSQGTTHTRKLLKEFFDNKPLQKRLIAAYLPGMGIQPNEFKTILPMTAPDEIGGFVSWNTFKKGHYPKKEKDWYKGSVTTNPITWDATISTVLAQHKGFLYSNDKLYRKALKIEITDGLVWSTNPKFPLRFFMSFLRNYHIGDINLFWQDIRENAELRTKKWLATH